MADFNKVRSNLEMFYKLTALLLEKNTTDKGNNKTDYTDRGFK